MTLEEARKEIQAHVNEQWEEFEKTGSLFCQGCAFGGNAALAILNEVDSEPVGKDKMTLTELTHELRKIFEFRYLTYNKEYGEDEIWLWQGEVAYVDGAWNDQPPYAMTMVLDPDLLSFTLDLSEYADENGVIDYSRCIVEVSDDIK